MNLTFHLRQLSYPQPFPSLSKLQSPFKFYQSKDIVLWAVTDLCLELKKYSFFLQQFPGGCSKKSLARIVVCRQLRQNSTISYFFFTRVQDSLYDKMHFRCTIYRVGCCIQIVDFQYFPTAKYIHLIKSSERSFWNQVTMGI